MDRLVLKAIADESPQPGIRRQRLQAVADALRTTRSTFTARKSRHRTHRVYDVQPVRGDNRTRNNREIERKFLVKRVPDNLKKLRCSTIEQGYLATESPGRQVRLRKRGHTASLTVKIGRGSHREEREIKLSPKQFAALWPGTAGRRLRKVRYEIPWDNVLIELDIYRGRHAGLVVAEVEFPDRASYRRFKAPSWFGREVTGEKRYSNVRLALK